MPGELYGEWVGGRNAGWASGRSDMRAVVCHYTVGRNSTSIGIDGYFHWLVSRDGHIQQFAEASAVAWHAGEANGVGPGIEVEYLDEPEGIFTGPQRDACGGLVRWLSREWGIPLTYYDGPRIPPSQMHEFVAHGSIQQSEGHTDYWPREDWNAMVGGGGGPDPEKDERMKPILCQNNDGIFVYDPNNHTKTNMGSMEAVAAMQSLRALEGENPESIQNSTTDALLKTAVELR